MKQLHFYLRLSHVFPQSQTDHLMFDMYDLSNDFDAILSRIYFVFNREHSSMYVPFLFLNGYYCKYFSHMSLDEIKFIIIIADPEVPAQFQRFVAVHYFPRRARGRPNQAHVRGEEGLLRLFRQKPHRKFFFLFYFFYFFFEGLYF